MSENIIFKLRTSKNFLSNAEKKIATLILDNPNKFITYTMQELAQKADVSHGSIINFSKKFACGGFPDLKLQIAASIMHTPDVMPKSVEAGDSINDVLDKVIQARTNAFELTRRINNENTWMSAIDKIISAKKIEIYGVYQSANIATSLYYELIQLGISVSFISDILMCAVSASMLDENSLVIAISSSGKTKDILDAVKNAKLNNVPVVAITANINSPLARLSDDVLIAATGNSIAQTQASQNLITDTICAYIKSTLKTEEQNKFIGIRQILNSHNVEETEYETLS